MREIKCIRCGGELPNPATDVYCQDCKEIGHLEDDIKISEANPDALVAIASAVVKKAKEDYLEVLRCIRDRENPQELGNALDAKRALVEWIHSKMFNAYTMGMVSPDYFMREIRKEFQREKPKRKRPIFEEEEIIERAAN